MKKSLLVFCEYYRPGIKGGGGMWTIANLIDRMGSEYDFSVVCRNHDGPTDLRPFQEVSTGKWNTLNNQRVFHVDPSRFTWRDAAKIVNDARPAAIFMNSVFGLTTRRVLEARRKGGIGQLPLIIAPCGELSENCLAIKPLKKAAYLKYSIVVGSYNDVIWKATTDAETAEITTQFGKDANVHVAPDLLPRSIITGFDAAKKPRKISGFVRIAIVARIAPKKNISYLLRRLSECTTGRFEVELIGGVDDEAYWKECCSLIQGLPSNVRLTYHGALAYPEVLERLVDCHLFALPTLNENFGYVFIEAMAAGCPLLISENTIWGAIEAEGCGKVIPLEYADEWRYALEEFAEMGPEYYAVASARARQFAVKLLEADSALFANRKLLEMATGIGSGEKGYVYAGE